MKTKLKTYTGFVRTNDGRYLIQKPAENQWGFALYDDDLSWPGGIGAAHTWTAVDVLEVPHADQERLGWLLDS